MDELGDRNVMLRPSRTDWVMTLAGIADSVWHLTDEEQMFVVGIVGRILDRYNIPERSDPVELPRQVVMECVGGFWTTQLTSHADVGLVRPVRVATPQDQTYPLEVWREALLGVLFCAYPDLEPIERVGLTRDFTDLLAAIGVPDRAPSYLPDDVVRTARTA